MSSASRKPVSRAVTRLVGLPTEPAKKVAQSPVADPQCEYDDRRRAGHIAAKLEVPL